MVQNVSARCQRRAQVNPEQGTLSQEGVQRRGQHPGKLWEPGFTEIWPSKGGENKVLVSFYRWVEMFPTQTETAHIVAQKLLQTLVPQFDLPLTMESNNGLAFIAKTSQ